MHKWKEMSTYQFTAWKQKALIVQIKITMLKGSEESNKVEVKLKKREKSASTFTSRLRVSRIRAMPRWLETRNIKRMPLPSSTLIRRFDLLHRYRSGHRGRGSVGRPANPQERRRCDLIGVPLFGELETSSSFVAKWEPTWPLFSW